MDHGVECLCPENLYHGGLFRAVRAEKPGPYARYLCYPVYDGSVAVGQVVRDDHNITHSR